MDCVVRGVTCCTATLGMSIGASNKRQVSITLSLVFLKIEVQDVILLELSLHGIHVAQMCSYNFHGPSAVVPGPPGADPRALSSRGFGNKDSLPPQPPHLRITSHRRPYQWPIVAMRGDNTDKWFTHCHFITVNTIVSFRISIVRVTVNMLLSVLQRQQAGSLTILPHKSHTNQKENASKPMP